MKKIIIMSLALLFTLLLSGCDSRENGKEYGSLVLTGSMELEFAREFSIDYCKGGYKLITLSDESRFLLIPEGAALPEGTPSDIAPLYAPLGDIYLVATSAMSSFDKLDSLDAITLSGTRTDGWVNENARRAMEEGKILYAGKYSEPDYELILREGARLAIESTMIGHMPEVKDKLLELGVAVMIDRSSLEEHPLGRTEWIKLYGVLLGKEEEAKRHFEEQTSYLYALEDTAVTKKTVAFFHISSSGHAVVRSPDDYISRMIELSGGECVSFGDMQTDASTIPVDIETFYAAAKDADCIIYNSAIAGELSELSELLSKSELLSDFKAVKSGEVWCADKALFQDTTELGRMIGDFRDMLSNTDISRDGFGVLYRLK